MRCDELRKSVTEGAPFDDEARGHLAACPSCGGEFPELRALTSPLPAPPAALRDRVLASFPARRAIPWGGLYKAAAILVIGIGVGFVSGFALNKTQLVEVPGPTVHIDRPVDKPVPDDYVSNVGIAAQSIYGENQMGENHLVEVTFVPNSVRIKSIVVDPKMKNIEKYCPVARQLGALAAKRPDVVHYRPKDY
jgi:hypothetical protein